MIVQPMLVAELVTYFKDPNSMSDTRAYVFGGLLAFTGVVMWIPLTHLFYVNQLVGARMRTACATLMYKKVRTYRSRTCATIMYTKR